MASPTEDTACLSQSLCAHGVISGLVGGLNSTAHIAAVGGVAGLCVFDLEWPWEPSGWLPHEEAVTALAWHPSDALKLAAAGRDGSLSTYDLEAEGIASSLTARWHLPSASADALAWSSTTEMLVAARSTEGAVVLWDARTDGHVTFGASAKNPAASSKAAGSSSNAAAASSKATPTSGRGALAWGESSYEHALAASCGAHLRIWDVRQPRTPLVEIADAHHGEVYSLSWLPSILPSPSARLLSCGSDGALRLWSVGALAGPGEAGTRTEKWRLLASAVSTLEVHSATCLAIPSDGDTAGAGSCDEAVALMVCTAPEGGGMRGAATDGPALRCLQPWFLSERRVEPTGAAGDASTAEEPADERAVDEGDAPAVELYPSEWVPAGLISAVAGAAGGAAFDCSWPPVQPLVAVGGDRCARDPRSLRPRHSLSAIRSPSPRNALAPSRVVTHVPAVALAST